MRHVDTPTAYLACSEGYSPPARDHPGFRHLYRTHCIPNTCYTEHTPGLYTEHTLYRPGSCRNFEAPAAMRVWACACLCACVCVHIFVCVSVSLITQGGAQMGTPGKGSAGVSCCFALQVFEMTMTMCVVRARAREDVFTVACTRAALASICDNERGIN